MTWGDFLTACAALLTLFSLMALVWRFPPLVKAIRWIDKHRSDDRTAALVGIISSTVQPMLADAVEQIDGRFSPRLLVLETRTQQLMPNGGSSMYDRMTGVEATMVQRGVAIEKLTDVVSVQGDAIEAQGEQLKAFGEDVRTVLRKVSQ